MVFCGVMGRTARTGQNWHARSPVFCLIGIPCLKHRIDFFFFFMIFLFLYFLLSVGSPLVFSNAGDIAVCRPDVRTVLGMEAPVCQFCRVIPPRNNSYFVFRIKMSVGH